MPKFNYVAAATILVAALAMASALRAEGKDGPRSKDMMMGPGMMEGCAEMMQGSSARPNEQWRKGGVPEPKGTSDKKQ
ncbi:MAG: hypothetical protein AB7O44_26800 [Hyphomicrobiaceae bacterium]